MYSLLAEANFEYKEMKLADLRDRIIEENQLTPLSILKGFHTVSSDIRLQYSPATSDTDSILLEELYKEINNMIPIWIDIVQKAYDETFNKLFDEFKKTMPTATIEQLIAGEYNDKSNYDVNIRNARWTMTKTLEYSDVAKNTLASIVKEFVQTWLDEHYPNYTIENKRLETLPTYLNLNKDSSINFDNIYVAVNSPYSSLFGDSYHIKIEYNPYLKSGIISKVAAYNIPTLYRKLDKSEAEYIFNDAINKIIYNDNKMSLLAYFQNLEAQPITININTKTNRCELIDGYKRLLFIANEDLLNCTAPVRVFTDLDDTGFMSLLYAANIWKYSANNRNAVFHDRGYLFALKTRYGFTIPEKAYNYYDNVLDVFYNYDFNSSYDYRAHMSYYENSLSIMDSLRQHNFTVYDMKFILDNLIDITSKDYAYDKNIALEIERFIIVAVGTIRKLPNNTNQKLLSDDLISSIFEDEYIVKNCENKHLSTNTYVKNHLAKKKVYKRIADILYENLV